MLSIGKGWIGCWLSDFSCKVFTMTVVWKDIRYSGKECCMTSLLCCATVLRSEKEWQGIMTIWY